jgi:hypothetical protein
MLISFSELPLVQWSADQKEYAIRQYGKIEEVSFPKVPIEADVSYVEDLAERCFLRITALIEDLGKGKEEVTILVRGEPSLSFAVVHLLQKEGFVCVVDASEKRKRLREDGTVEVVHDFYRFREYPRLS